MSGGFRIVDGRVGDVVTPYYVRNGAIGGSRHGCLVQVSGSGVEEFGCGDSVDDYETVLIFDA